MSLSNITANIRVDATTRQGSVIDTIQLVHPQKSADAAKTLKRLLCDFEDLRASCPHLKINGKGMVLASMSVYDNTYADMSV